MPPPSSSLMGHRWSRYYLYTTREVPGDAEVVSHRLMARAGMIKKLAAGIYTYAPLARRTIGKLEAIVRAEMEKAGGVELLMPAIQPASLWQESGRWEQYGKELLRIRDRHQRDFCFGPTHEEVVTDLVRGDVKSYRQLPILLYQIQTKFRDEVRPRFGLMRGREFLMKDAYSFHTSEESLRETYELVCRAYRGIFDACRLDYTMVEADTGSIGGSSSHEFMVLASTGESAVVSCRACGYAANVEKAEAPKSAAQAAAGGGADELRQVATPGLRTIGEVSKALGLEPRELVKTLLYEADGKPVAVAVRGDHEVNEIKLQNALAATEVRLADDAAVERATGAPTGFLGPVGLAPDVPLWADHAARGLASFGCGANRADAHYVGAQWGRDAEPTAWADLRLVRGGDPCPRCGATLEESRGIEVGHTFMLGVKYSAAMGAGFTDERGATHPLIMGCYGLGLGRTMAAAIEQNHDEHGIIWPLPLAPFQVLLVSLNPNDEAVRRQSDELYDALCARGVEVLYDDRDERPGVKFNDADLVGIPIRLVVGGKSLARGEVELSLRRDREKHAIPVAEAVTKTLESLSPLEG
ncbi:MAG TPA: proline--tRNA ligase [Thermoanaerobaculia bacterium]|nr:proline--tRNA ligase [Thermoanaerobaculia bacterium]